MGQFLCYLEMFFFRGELKNLVSRIEFKAYVNSLNKDQINNLSD